MTGDNTHNSVGSPTLHATILFTIAVFVALLVMSFVFRTEVVARGQGRVVPLGRVQVVQPEFPGQVEAIHVRDGMVVEQGDLLTELDPTEARTALATLTSEDDRLVIEAARIQALAGWLDAVDDGADDGTRPQMPSIDLAADLASRPAAAEQRQLLTAEIEDIEATLRQIAARRETLERSLDVAEANVARAGSSIATQEERVGVMETLLSQGATTQAATRDATEALTNLQNDREVFARELAARASEIDSLDAERRALFSGHRQALQARHTEIEARRAVLAEEIRAATRRLEGTRLVAPVSGTVAQMSVFTIGGVVGAGTEVMRIVPGGDRVEVEAIFPNADIGFMEIGQTANLGFDAYPSERFGFVRGTVSDISADAVEVPSGGYGFVVRITPEAAALVTRGERFPIRPGMTAEAAVTTDRRRLITYFFAPIVEVVQGSLGER